MRRLSIILAFCTSALVLCPTGTAFAQEVAQLPSPGITPDSPFYFWDELAEQIALRFTFREETRAQRAFQYAEERLAEMNCMMIRNNVRATIRAMNGYNNLMNTAMEAVEVLGNRGAHIQAMVAFTMAKHAAILDDFAGELPEEAREIMTQISERARICQQTALRLMEQEDPEMANKVRIELMERQRNSIKVMAGMEENTSVQQDSQDTGQPTILDQGYNGEQPQLGLGNQDQVHDNGQHTVNSRLRQNSMFGEPPSVTPTGKESPDSDSQKIPIK